MPLNPFENLPASLMTRKSIEKFFESFNEVKVNGSGNGPSDALSDHHAKFQAKEADVEAISELTRALDKKVALVNFFIF